MRCAKERESSGVRIASLCFIVEASVRRNIGNFINAHLDKPNE